MMQRYIINNPSATVTVDGIAEGQAIAVKWCKSEDVAELEAEHQKLLQEHSVMKQALKWIADDDYTHFKKRMIAINTLKYVAEVKP